MWAYAYGAGDPLGNVVFKKALTYTGLEGSSTTVNPEVLDSVYFTQWSDPDLGTYTDDYVDVVSFYVYNGNRLMAFLMEFIIFLFLLVDMIFFNLTTKYRWRWRLYRVSSYDCFYLFWCWFIY